MRLHRWICALLVAFALLPGGVALADAPTVAPVETKLGENVVRYPKLEGLADEAIQAAVNDDIVESADILKLLVALAVDDGWGVRVDYEAYLQNDVLSVAISCKRRTHSVVGLCYDIKTGERIAAGALFADADAALAFMEERLTDTYADELSGYLENAAITPIPTDSFSIDANGVTFYYPYESFSTLSGFAGECQFQYTELTEYLNLGEDSVLTRIGVNNDALADDQIKARIDADISAGRMPGFGKVALGDSMSDAIGRYRLLREPDQFPGGKYYQMESAAFRQIRVLSDALTDGWDASVVEGIQSLRADLYGIRCGETTVERWRQILGEPTRTMTLTENMAYDYALCVGACDFYTFGENELRLYADADGVLYAAQVAR